jgi:hypothetical protein
MAAEHGNCRHPAPIHHGLDNDGSLENRGDTEYNVGHGRDPASSQAQDTTDKLRESSRHEDWSFSIDV